MIRLYKSLQTGALFFIPLIALALWLPGFFKESFLVSDHMGFIDLAIFNVIGSLPKFCQIFIAVFLISFEAIYLNLAVNRHQVLEKDSYLPALIYMVLMSFNRDVICFHQMLLINLLLIYAFDKIFSLFKNDRPVSAIFDCGLLLSIISLIYFPSIILILFFLIVLFILRSFNFREWSIALSAFLLPYFFFSVYSFLTDSLESVFAEFISKFSFYKIQFAFQQNEALVSFLLFFSLMLILSLFRLRANFYKNAIKTRNAQQILVILSLFIIGEILFLKKIELNHFTQLAIPFSVFLSCYYISARKRLWLFEVSFWILLVLILQSYL